MQRVRKNAATISPSRGPASISWPAEEKPSKISALVRAPQAGALANIPLSSVSRTPLEDYRKKHGLDLVRSKLLSQLASEASLEKGLSRLNSWTMARLDRPCTTIADARVLFPNVTLTEICMLGLLERAPKTFLYQGTGFDVAEVLNRSRAPDKQRRRAEDYQMTPMQLEFRPDGISYGTDRSEYNVGLSSELDPKDREIVSFRKSVREKIAELVVLMIDRARLFELLRSNTTDTLVVGVGRIRQAALSAISLETASAPDKSSSSSATPSTGSSKIRSIADDLAELPPEKKSAYQEREQEIAQKILGARLRYDDGTSMDPTEIVHLLGMLRDIPSCLLQEQAFDGKILFDGEKLLFADKEDCICEVAPLERQCLDTLKQSIFDEQTRSSETNRTLLAIQDDLTARVQGALFGDLIGSDKESQNLAQRTSPIEEIALRVFREYGVAVWGRARTELRITKATEESPEKGGFVAGGPVANITLKLGLAELQQIEMVLGAFGPRLVAGVTSIEKIQGSVMSDGAADEGRTCSVTFRSENSALCIGEYQELPFTDMRPKARTERAFLIAHAVGCSLWRGVEDKTFWGRIRSASEPLQQENDPKSRNFVHSIAKRNAQSDFAACVAAYVLARPEFAGLSKSNPVLKLKFEAVEAFLQGKLPPAAGARSPEISLSEAALGLRAQFPDFPDFEDPEAIRRYLAKQEQKKQSAEVMLTRSEEQSMTGDVKSLVDYERAKAKLALRQQIRVVVESCFEGIRPGLRDGLVDKVLAAVEENEDLNEVISDFAEENPKLYDLLSDPDDFDGPGDNSAAEALVSALHDAGIIAS
jgi:hypothetical protein